MKLLDKALNQLRDLGLVPDKTEEAPIIALLNRITEIDEDRVVAIARTLSQTSLFNEVVRAQISAMEIGERYEKITDGFDSIRKDAKSMVEQFEDGDIDAWERLHNIWVKVTRGDIAHRFEKIKHLYLDLEFSKENIQVTKRTRDSAEQSLNLARERYNLARASSVELAEAEALYAVSNAKYMQAIYNYNINVARLERATGEIDESQEY